MTDFDVIMDLLDENGKDYEIVACGTNTYVFVGKSYVLFDRDNKIKDVVRG